MLKRERHLKILQSLQAEGVVRVADLAAALDASPVTIRRDLTQLDEEGKLRRVHGGAVIRNYDVAPSPTSGLTRRIAETAAKFVPDESVVFLGPGTLTAEVVPFFQPQTHLTLVTNALNAACSAARQGQHTLHLIGGQVGEGYGIYGDPEPLHRIRADFILLEADGLDAERGLTHDDRDYAGFARSLFLLSAQVIVLMPPDRLGRAGALFIAPASEVDILVTGREAENPLLWDLSELGVRIVLT